MRASPQVVDGKAQEPRPTSAGTAAGAWICLLGGLTMAVGSFLPWMRDWYSDMGYTSSLSANGFQLGDPSGAGIGEFGEFSLQGVATLLCGVLLCAVGISLLQHSFLQWVPRYSAVVLVVIAAVVIVLSALDIHESVAFDNTQGGEHAWIGYGVWVAAIGCGIAAIGAVLVPWEGRKLSRT